MEPDPEIELAIRGNAEWLDNYVEPIMSCRVVVDRPHQHHKDGNLYQIRLDVKVPGREVAVTREPGQNVDYRDPDRVIREAFDELRRQLEDHTQRLRREVKAHEPAPHARVSRIFPAGGYGFLETPDGREIYFHRNSVLKAKFESLQVGTEVRLVEELGDKGPQASTVIPVGRHSHL
jgi:cold shock CspA family protein